MIRLKGKRKKETSSSLILLWNAQGAATGISLDSCWEGRTKAPLWLLHLPMLIASHPYLQVSESLTGPWEHAPSTRSFLLSTPMKARCADVPGRTLLGSEPGKAWAFYCLPMASWLRSFFHWRPCKVLPFGLHWGMELGAGLPPKHPTGWAVSS